MKRTKSKHKFKIGDTIKCSLKDMDWYGLGEVTHYKGLLTNITKYHAFIRLDSGEDLTTFPEHLRFVSRNEKNYKKALSIKREELVNRRNNQMKIVDNIELEIAKVDAILDDL